MPPLEVYRCSYAEDGRACGLGGETYDRSHDECHHPLDLEFAEELAKRWNFHEQLVAACKEALAAVDEAYTATGFLKVCRTSEQRLRIESALKLAGEIQ
jgi:hypothetical protein